MSLSSLQAPQAVIMIRPHNFSPNPLTAADNAFQRPPETFEGENIAQAAYNEVTAAAACLNAFGIDTFVFEDYTTETPDSVFPNNWFSTHAGGRVAVYPMYAPNRRKERRPDVIEMLKTNFKVDEVVDYSSMESDGVFLEGTGAMVLDHIGKIAYAAISKRTSPKAFKRFCNHFEYEPVLFQATDKTGQPIYHTNVLMCVATDFVLIGLDMIRDKDQRDNLRKSILASGRTIIELSEEQINKFAGNALELQSYEGRVLALSRTAMDALKTHQIDIIEKSAELLPLDVPAIEMSGGSVRCMMAGIHLTPRPSSVKTISVAHHPQLSPATEASKVKTNSEKV